MGKGNLKEPPTSHPSFGPAPMAMMGQPPRSTVSPRPPSAAHSTSSISHGPIPTIEGQRSLPDRDATAESIENDYVQFIFYCNPTLPGDTDTTELRKGFHAMPKTDGKTFQIFTLFELIKKWELKVIETWSQLVIDMGVAPPDVASGQSTQKVQQYAVRLKRWLHAYHIDAFFQYCLGKTNPYYTDIPTDADALTTAIRDGVAPDEDLALRALLPQMRPKRGRRPNDEGTSSPAVKRQLRAASLTAEEQSYTANPMSAYPQSASPWDRDSNQRDPWAAAHRAIAPHPQQTPVSAQQPMPDQGQINFYMDLQDPNTAHPQSAISPRPPMSFPQTSTPQSAHPSLARSRKRHGASVSAAWTAESSSGGKLRGRPPANRTVQDGPFSTFPAKQTPPPGLATPTSGTPGSAQVGQGSSPFGRSPPAAMRKPSKLQLQVPQHAGGPVRLATPPAPRVLLNGSEGDHRGVRERRSSADFFNVIDEDPSELGESEDEGRGAEVDWKKRVMALQRKVRELETELKSMKRRVLEAVM